MKSRMVHCFYCSVRFDLNVVEPVGEPRHRTPIWCGTCCRMCREMMPSNARFCGRCGRLLKHEIEVKR